MHRKISGISLKRVIKRSILIVGMTITIQRIDNPNEHFQGKEREELVDILKEIAEAGFGKPKTRESVERHILGVQYLYLIESEGEKIGFSSYTNFEMEEGKVTYLNGIVIRPDFQNRGLFYRVNQEALTFLNPDYLTMTTQNPAIYAGTKKLVKEIFPGPSGVPEEIRRIAALITKELGSPEIDLDLLVQRGKYEESLYPSIAQHSEARPFFDHVLQLDYGRGDAVLIVGRLK